MADVVGRAVIKITGDLDSRSFTDSGSRISRGLRSSLIPAGAALAGLGAIAIKSAKGAEDLASKQRVLNQVLANMGQTGAQASAQKLAQDLESLTAVDDKVVLGNEAILASFASVGKTAGQTGGAFQRATKLSLDLAAVMKTAPAGAAKQLGKALEDPVKGISALGRAGVTFTSEQKATIKTLVETGQKAKAQGIILEAVQKKVGGAAAAAKTPSEALKVAFDNISDSLGTLLLPALSKVAAGLTSLANAAAAHPRIFAAVGVAIGAIAASLIAVNVAMFLIAANPVALVIGAIVLALVALGAALVVAYKKSQTFRTIVNAAFTAVKVVALVVWNGIKAAALIAFRIISTYIRVQVAIWTAIFRTVRAVIVAVWNAVKTVAITVWRAISKTVVGAFNSILKAARSVKAFLVGMWSGIKSAGVAAFDKIRAAVNNVIRGVNHAIDAFNAIPLIPGTIGHIPFAAGGVQNFGGGPLIVGERGPELVTLPRGANVFSNAQTRGMLGSGQGNVITINQIYNGPSTGSSRNRETDWSLRFGSASSARTSAAGGAF